MLAGDLHDFQLRDVLRLLADGRKSGAVHVERGDELGRIDLVDGGVSAVGIADRVVAAGDDVFVESAALLLGWHEGTFRFEGDTQSDADSDSAVPAVTVPDLLQHAATRAERLVALAEAQGPRTVKVFLATAPDADDVVLTAPVWDLAVTIGDGRSIGELTDRTGVSELTVRELVDELARAGLATVGDGAPEASGGDEPGDDRPAAHDGADVQAALDRSATTVEAEAGMMTDAVDSGVDAGDGSSDAPLPVGEGAQEVPTGDGNVAPDVLARVVKGLEAH